MPSPWINEWNDIIRNIIFKDTELKALMEIPTNTNIISFIDNYFIKAGYTTKLLTNQKVRIVYGTIDSSESSSPNVSRDIMSFDIYVKNEELHNYGNDRLVYRNELIADRLKYLLSKERLNGYKFWKHFEGNMGTNMVGYSRYNVSFSFMRT